MSMYRKGVEVGSELAEPYITHPGFAAPPPPGLITYADRDVEIGVEKDRGPLAEAALFLVWIVGIPTVVWLASK